MACLVRRLALLSFLMSAGAIASTDQEPSQMPDKPVLAMNVFSQEARLRTGLFESIANRYGFDLINGRWGGEFNNDQLAIKEQDGRTILLLGLKSTSPSGDLQLDQMSMGPFLQFSSNWLSAVIQCLKIDRMQLLTATKIEFARDVKALDFVVLLVDKNNKDVKFLKVTVPE